LVVDWQMRVYAASVDVFLIFFMIDNVWQAYRAAEARGAQLTGLHRPLVAGVASLLVPGWGQMLNGQMGKAIIFLFSFLLQAYLLALFLLSPFVKDLAGIDPQQIVLRRAIQLGMGILFVT